MHSLRPISLRKIFWTLIAQLVLLSSLALLAPSQAKAPEWTAQEQPIYDQIKGLRGLPDDVRAKTTGEIAREIRTLPATPGKVRLASYLASRATEGDCGHDSLQAVATTLADALREQPGPTLTDPKTGVQVAGPVYLELAELARYEHMQVSLDLPQYKIAMAKLEADDQARQNINFTLTDLTGKSWTLKDLKGKVVMVNFWATWCPPCQKEMPDLETLSKRFADQGFVILAISDETPDKVKPFIAERKITYPILLDREHKVSDQFQVNGIPKSFVYDREGKLVTESIDMRTQKQFLEMLAQAGLQ